MSLSALNLGMIAAYYNISCASLPSGVRKWTQESDTFLL